MSEHVCRAGSDEDTSRCFLCGASVTPIDSAPSDGLTDEDKRRIRSEANLHMIEWLEDTEATIDTLTTQLSEMTRERDESNALLHVNQDAHKRCDVLMGELGRKLTAAEATADRYEGAIAVLWRIAQYDPRWVGMHVNDAPGRSKIIALAYDAHHALSTEQEVSDE